MLNARRQSTLSDESDGVELDDHVSKEKRPLLQENTLQNTITSYYNIIYADFATAIRYVITDAKRHKKGFIIGIATVFIVVMFVSLLQNVIQKSPIVFLKLSEDEVGEFDMVMTSPTNLVINYTQTAQLLSDVETVEGLAPRWLSIARLVPDVRPETNSSVILIAIDSLLEKKIGIGRSWTHRPLGDAEMHVTSSVLRRMDVLPNTNTSVNMVIDLLGYYENLAGTGDTPADIIMTQIEEQSGFNFTQNITIPDFAAQLQELLGDNVNVTDFLDSIIGPGSYNLQKGVIYPDKVFLFMFANFKKSLVINTPFIVCDGIDEPDGKYPKALGNVAVIESKYLENIVRNAAQQATSFIRQNLTDFEELAPFLEPFGLNVTNITDIVLQALEVFDQLGNTTSLNDFAPMIIVMDKHRVDSYKKDQGGLDSDMIEFTNAVSEGVGVDYPVSTELPIAVTLKQFQFTKMSLDQIFNCVACVMLALGGMLIYSLLLNDVEAKTYEYGMLRGLGMRQYVLIELLLTQAIYFSIPGILFGLLFGWLIYLIVAAFIASFVNLPVDVEFTTSAIVVAVLLGFFMPIVANIFPIRRALTHTLRDALDIYHQVRNETNVQIIRLEKLGLDPWQLVLAFCTVFFGFIIYYMVPYSFIYQNFSLFFMIMSGILLGMLFGLALIAQTIQPMLEKAALLLIMWGWDRSSLSSLVRKNLFSHMNRNLKTAIMFTICLTFIIFAGTVFRLQGHSIGELVQLGVGGDLWVFSPRAIGPLPEDDLRAYLESDMLYNAHTVVLGYTFITYTLTYSEGISNTRLSNLADYPEVPVRVVGVEENFLNVAYDRFFNPTEYDLEFTYDEVDGKPDVIKSLYTDAGKELLPLEKGGIAIPPTILPTNSTRIGTPTQSTTRAYKNYVDVIISEAMRVTASVDTSVPMRLKMDTHTGGTGIYLAKARALLNRAPGFFFSSYSLAAYFSPVLVSMPVYQRFLNASMKNPPLSPPKQTLLIRTKPEATLFEREGVINGVRNFLSDDSIIVQNTQDIIDSTKIAVNLLDLFFYTVATISVILCFFVLWLSFTANVNENSWEFGVLRSIGLTSFQVIRVYVYEALAIIIASVLLGASIGMIVSISLTVQLNLFTELPFWFQFPYVLFFGVLAMSVGVAVAGSYFPLTAYKEKPISAVLKGQ
eukprot:Phypoly_transcript_01036.p1 GENE.Phypoly_transcript_01036~~Phypoly_transcript_01036.p1  ORF type:complete len:1168 (+),score=174.37 Phypoly_transcript_01036:78-3581(+)